VWFTHIAFFRKLIYQNQINGLLMNCRKLLQIIVLPALLFFSQIAFAQDRVITGRVTDSTGAGVAGVTVTAKGTQIVTQTNADGTFSLKLPSSVTSLVFTSVGMATQEMSISGRSSLNVSMNGAASVMNEVVVIGYGTRQKKDLTGSVTSITEKDFNKGNIVTPEQLIAGKVAGVNVVSNSGAPGSGSTIRIRGGASLNASNDPLFVIDGVPVEPGGLQGVASPFSFINPNDIESINILKDASATAIYGSRASNGVIIVTTKRGRTGKPRFNFNSQYSLSTVYKTVDVMSADQLRAYVKANGTAAQIALLGGSNTNWQDEIYQNAGSLDNNLSVSGSLWTIPYRISGGYLDQKGILRTGYLKRKSLDVAVSPKLFSNRLKFDINLKTADNDSRFANTAAIGTAVVFDPTKPVYSGSKRYGGFYEWLEPANTNGLTANAPHNPVGQLEQTNYFGEAKRTIGNIVADWKMSKSLRANLNLGMDNMKSTQSQYGSDSAADSYRSYLDPNGVWHGGFHNHTKQEKQNKLLEFYMNYNRDFQSIGKFDLVGGFGYQDFWTKNYNFPTFFADDVMTTAGVPTFPFDKPRHTLVSWYSRLNYNWSDKYYLTASIRTDGSSRFSPAYRWGTFPSFAVAWRLKSESFLQSAKVLNELKLRLGYGKTGQQEGIGNYDYISYYALSTLTAQYQINGVWYQMYRPGGYYANRKWEETKTYNAAVDFGFWDNRINGTLDVYYKKTSDLLNQIDQPAGTNFVNKIVANIGDMENRGVELNVNSVPVRNRLLTWELGFNITYNKNKITKLTIFPDPANQGNQYGGISGGVGNTILINSVNHSRGSFFVYQQVYDDKGNPIENLFVDRNGDGVVNEQDKYQYKSIDPKMFFGINSSVSIKKWTAGFLLRGSIDNYVYNNVYSNLGKGSAVFQIQYLNNASVNLLETNFTGLVGTNVPFSDYYVQNGSFLKMDYINIGYAYGKVAKGQADLRLNASVQNVFTITKYKGIDPEIPGGIDNNFYPRPRIYSIGLNLDF
jgi:iron complex outermembrane receptor protein